MFTNGFYLLLISCFVLYWTEFDVNSWVIRNNLIWMTICWYSMYFGILKVLMIKGKQNTKFKVHNRESINYLFNTISKLSARISFWNDRRSPLQYTASSCIPTFKELLISNLSRKTGIAAYMKAPTAWTTMSRRDFSDAYISTVSSWSYPSNCDRLILLYS